MEYEIGDDPQGLTEDEEADRGGGIRAPVSYRKSAPTPRKPPSDPQHHIEQIGEAA